MNLMSSLLAVGVLTLILILLLRFMKKRNQKEWLIFERRSTIGSVKNVCYYGVHKFYGFTTGCYNNIKDLLEELNDNDVYGPID